MRNQILHTAVMLFALAMPFIAMAGDALPKNVTRNLPAELQRAGSSKYKKLGFSVYDVVLWAPGGKYKKNQPRAIQLHYLRELSQGTVADAVVKDVRAQKMADNSTMDKWEKILRKAFPAVKDGDEIIGISMPGKASKLFFNGKQIATISDKRLSDSIFNIWLGKAADSKLRAQLLANAK